MVAYSVGEEERKHLMYCEHVYDYCGRNFNRLRLVFLTLNDVRSGEAGEKAFMQPFRTLSTLLPALHFVYFVEIFDILIQNRIWERIRATGKKK